MRLANGVQWEVRDWGRRQWSFSRGGDDDFSVDKLLVELAVLALFVRGCHESVALRLDPRAESKLVLGCPEELWDLFCVLMAIVENEEYFALHKNRSVTCDCSRYNYA